MLCSCAEAADPSDDSGGEPQNGAQTNVCAGHADAVRGDLVGLEMASQQGKTWRLVSAVPREPVVGDSTWIVAIEERGVPVPGLAERTEVTPFMPDHGHGTAVAVEVQEVEPGSYQWSPINLRMPGYWLITAVFDGASGDDASSDGASSGDAASDGDVLQLGVCVE